MPGHDLHELGLKETKKNPHGNQFGVEVHSSVRPMLSYQTLLRIF